MDISIIQQIMTFFNNACDLTSDYVDRIEINPIRLYGNIYITGFKRGFVYGSTVDAHIKELRRIQVKTNTAIGDEEGYYFMEPDNEMWIPCVMLSEELLKIAFKQFKECFESIKEFHVLDVQYKEKGVEKHHSETIYYQNKRTGCKDAIKFRKDFEQCSTKFRIFNKEGVETHKQTDFEILTAAVE
jgi:hypothetical protein